MFLIHIEAVILVKSPEPYRESLAQFNQNKISCGRGWGTYREPGNSGYKTSDIPSDMLKYWNACVDPRTGDRKNCSMDTKINYIKCLKRGCATEKCPDTESQIDCSSFLQKDEILKCRENINGAKTISTRRVRGMILECWFTVGSLRGKVLEYGFITLG